MQIISRLKQTQTLEIVADLVSYGTSASNTLIRVAFENGLVEALKAKDLVVIINDLALQDSNEARSAIDSATKNGVIDKIETEMSLLKVDLGSIPDPYKGTFGMRLAPLGDGI